MRLSHLIRQVFATLATAGVTACGALSSGVDDTPRLVGEASSALATSGSTPTVRVVAAVRNPTSAPIELGYGACFAALLVYTTPERRGTPVWDSDAQGGVCILIGLSQTVAPGASFTPDPIVFEKTIASILGDSLPDRHYYLSLRLSLGAASPRDLPAGDLDLVIERPPLPDTRDLRSLRYSALPVTADINAGTITAAGSIVLVGAMSARVSVSHDCPLVLVAYRDRARRDAAPRSGAPDWTQPVVCGTADDDVTLFNGDGRDFAVTVRQRDVLGSALAAGRYYFAVILDAGGYRTHLSAGDAVLSR